MPEVHSADAWLPIVCDHGNNRGSQPALSGGIVSPNPGTWAASGGFQYPYAEVSAPLECSTSPSYSR